MSNPNVHIQIIFVCFSLLSIHFSYVITIKLTNFTHENGTILIYEERDMLIITHYITFINICILLYYLCLQKEWANNNIENSSLSFLSWSSNQQMDMFPTILDKLKCWGKNN